MTKIEPCLFCNNVFPGSDLDLEYYIGRSESQGSDPVYFVVCDQCSASGPSEMNIEDAIKAWNQRKAIATRI